MKPDQEKHEFESSGNISKNNFEIGDTKFVLNLLTDKLYADKVRVIVQEYSCNARDAHREIGKHNEPIKISTPNTLFPFWSVRDFGPGISPDRMQNVFVKYGVSTKRDDNVQTGGFGIGAKSAFSYSSLFTITTYIKGIKRIYNAVMEEDDTRSVSLQSETATTEPDGTEIKIPVKRENFQEFHTKTLNAIRWWKTKPFVNGIQISEKEDYLNKKILSGKNWYIITDYYSSDRNGLFAIVDEIEYPIKRDVVDNTYIPSFSHGTAMFFEFSTGDVAVAATREALDYKKKTISAINESIKVLQKELLDNIQKKITDCKSFAEANQMIRSIQNSVGLHKPIETYQWNGVSLLGDRIHLNGVAEMVYFTFNRNGNYATKITKSSTDYLTFDTKTVYVVFDRTTFDSIADKGASAVFRKFPDAETVCMMKIHDQNKFNKMNLNLLNPVKFSDYYTPTSRKEAIGKLMFFHYNYGTFNRTSIKAYEEDTNNQKIWCLFTRNYSKEACASLFGKTYSPSQMSALMSTFFPGVSLYGFASDTPSDRLLAATEEMVSLETAIKNLLEEYKPYLYEAAFWASISQNRKMSQYMGINFEFCEDDLMSIYDKLEKHAKTSSFMNMILGYSLLESANSFFAKVSQLFFEFDKESISALVGNQQRINTAIARGTITFEDFWNTSKQFIDFCYREEITVNDIPRNYFIEHHNYLEKVFQQYPLFKQFSTLSKYNETGRNFTISLDNLVHYVNLVEEVIDTKRQLRNLRNPIQENVLSSDSILESI